MKFTLTEKETWTAINALYIVSGQYKLDAANAFLNMQLQEQFKQQEKEAHALAIKLQNEGAD